MRQPAVTIRQLGAEDAGGFRALRLKALVSAPTAFASSYEEDAALTDEMLRARLVAAPSAVFAAFAGEEMVGMAGFAALSGPKRRHRGLLWGVFVEADQRGRGIARRLVEQIVAHARQHVLVLEAGVTSGNDSARGLYESLGFRHYGTLSKALRIDDAFYDEVLLSLDLAE